MDVVAELPAVDDNCGKFFKYRDFFECSDSWKIFRVDNVPQQPATYAAIRRLCRELLDPVWREFGAVHLTYGFASRALVNVVKRSQFPNITPSGDQHAGCELNSKGEPICKRLGIAVDFYVAGVSSLRVAKWVIRHTGFDRLYFYSPHRPFHVSVGPDNSRSVVWMDGYRGGPHQPKNVRSEDFLTRDWDFA